MYETSRTEDNADFDNEIQITTVLFNLEKYRIFQCFSHIAKCVSQVTIRPTWQNA